MTQLPAHGPMSNQEARNRRTVLEFYERVLIPMDFTAAMRFFGPTYTQHDPLAADGPEGLRSFLDAVRVATPHATTSIRRVFVDGDYVIVHVHVTPVPGTPGLAVADFFRLEDGKIVEHWDVIQPVPQSTLNPNSMF
jgi:predicted SnoaL-like aldol condensation-catalyzing enzyme